MRSDSSHPRGAARTCHCKHLGALVWPSATDAPSRARGWPIPIWGSTCGNAASRGAVVLHVQLDERFEATAIYEAGRVEVARALGGPGSRARNERGPLSVSNFKAIGKRIWPAP